jgi:hypothetical protein
MLVAGVSLGGGVVGQARARAQSSDPTQPPPAAAEPVTQPPVTIPDVDQPVSPATPLPPGQMPPMASPDALPPPAPLVQPVQQVQQAQIDGQPAGYPMWRARMSAAMLLGAGYEDFTYSNVKAMTGGGTSWDARLVGGTRQIIGAEVAYVGAARSIQTLGLATNSDLVSNGVEGALRLNLPLVQGATLIEPFGFIGVGWQHYTLTHASTNTSDLTGSDDVLAMPYGGGIEASYRKVMLDARFTYRQTYNNDLLRTEGGRLNTWGVGGNVGVEF